MTPAELLFDLLLIAVVAYCLARVNLQAVRRERDMYRRDASHNAAVADARHHTAQRVGQELIAAHVAVESAHAAMRDAFAQRDAALAEKADLQRRLATATKPKVASHE